MNKTYLLALALIATAPMASATTFNDASGDALLGSKSLDILSVDVSGDGSNLVVVFQLDDLRANQFASRYAFHINDHNDLQISVNCYLGFGFILLQSGTCHASHEVFSPGGGVAQVERINSTSSFDLTADTITVSVPYTEFSAGSGDVVHAILGASAKLIADTIPTIGDDIDADTDVVLS